MVENCLQSVADTILSNKGVTADIGLLNGKMGIVIFCYQYARITGRSEFESHAGKVLDEVFEEINIYTPLSFNNGLAGIGWGIEFLAQNGFINADTNEVLEDVDVTMFKSLRFEDINGIGLSDGLMGIGFYLLMRIKNPANNDNSISTLMVKYYTIFLIDELERRTRELTGFISENCSDTYYNRNSKPFPVMAWDFPVLVCLLAELLDQDIFNYKVEKIISRLMVPLKEIVCKQNSDIHKLLLLCSIEKLKLSFSDLINGTRPIAGAAVSERMEIFGILKESSDALITQIDSSTMETEISGNNTFSGAGVGSITWLYGQLLKFTCDSGFGNNINYWATKAINYYSKSGYTFNSILGDLPDLNILLYGSVNGSFNRNGQNICSNVSISC